MNKFEKIIVAMEDNRGRDSVDQGFLSLYAYASLLSRLFECGEILYLLPADAPCHLELQAQLSVVHPALPQKLQAKLAGLKI